MVAEGAVGVGDVDPGFDLRIRLRPTLPVHEEHAAGRDVLDASGRDELTFERPAGRLRIVDGPDDLRPVLPPFLTDERHLDCDEHLVHGGTLSG